MTQAADAERSEPETDGLAASVGYITRGFGATCTVCGALVVGDDGRVSHGRHHQALADLRRLPRS